MRAYRFWTADDTALALSLRAEGRAVAEIGSLIGRSASSVEQRLFQANGGFHSRGRICGDCPAPIRDDSKSGYCRSCGCRRQNADKAFTAKRLKGLGDSPKLAKGSALRHRAARKAAQARLADPDYRRRLIHSMVTIVQPASTLPEAIAKRKEARLAWCPPEHRDEYHQLRERLKVSDAKTIIKQKISDAKRNMTFEEKLQAVLDGRATIYTVPTAANSEPEFTLGGVSSGWAA
jgi:hypothetical protein